MMDCTDKKPRSDFEEVQYSLAFVSERRTLANLPYISSASGDPALNLLESWWEDARHSAGGQGIIISGPAGSGKTFLAGTALAGGGATHLDAAEIEQFLNQGFNAALVILDNTETVVEPVLLTRFVDACRERGCNFVLIGQDKPDAWAQSGDQPLTDLVTRLSALPEVSLDSPTAELMTEVLVAWMKNRQIRLSPELAGLAASVLKRSFASLAVFADRLDTKALNRQKTIDRTMVQTLLADMPEHTLS